MKRLLIILAAAIVAAGAMAEGRSTAVNIKGDLSPYKYAYVIPTSNVVSSSGASFAMPIAGAPVAGVFGNKSTTVNPSEIISGFLIKMGYSILPSVVPELAEETIIVSYGQIGTTPDLFGISCKIIIQISSGKTHEILASFESEGQREVESDAITEAIYNALDIFYYSVNPKLKVIIQSLYRNGMYVAISNLTPNPVHQILLKFTYYLEGELVHTQQTKINIDLNPGITVKTYISRDKPARSNMMDVFLEVISYE